MLHNGAGREPTTDGQALQMPPLFSRAWYNSSIAEFLCARPEAIVGHLAINSDFDILPAQRDAWLAQIYLLQQQLIDVQGSIYLEFSIPRMGRRIDAVLIAGPAVFAVEFKVGEARFDQSALDQVWDYALDLKNFHEGSHSASIVPILVATAAVASPVFEYLADADQVCRPIAANGASFREVLDKCLARISGNSIDATLWSGAPYHPTPTIVEAARALYAQHSVEAIARYDAGAQNLRVTSRRVEELIDDARAKRRKLICFVTGVPGAGKTLVGLNIATQHREVNQPTHAVFLSGNGPLVAVLREALTRDEVTRQRSNGVRVRKGKIGESVKAFIQNVHHFRDDLLIDSRADNKRYLCNAYRVLLTRSRQGMAIYVPSGDTSDATRLPAFYDKTYQYLRELGIPELNMNG